MNYQTLILIMYIYCILVLILKTAKKKFKILYELNIIIGFVIAYSFSIATLKVKERF